MKKFIAFGVILLFLMTSIVSSTAQCTEKTSPTTGRGNWLYVGGSGSGNYSKIQDAVDNASDGDIIFVFNGTYYENIAVDKEIKLLGDNKNNTIIDGSSGNDSIIIIKANEVYIGGFTIRNSNPYHRGIFFLPNCNGVSIIDNIIKNNRGAILLSSSHHTNISGNILFDNYNNPTIELTNSSDNTIYRNIVIHTSGDNHDSIGLFDSSNNNKIIGNTITLGLFGINVVFSSNHNKIQANNIRNCNYGICLSGASYNEISSNAISDNNRSVILVWYADHNIINNNIISNNINGIRAETTSNSSNNTIYHNNFLNNTIHASVSNDCINKWDNGYPSCGNYWDSYTGDDAFWGQNQDTNGSDGIGDTPMVISSGENQDRYPLMEPYAMTTLAFDLSGGFGIRGTIKNIGNSTAFRVCWMLTLDGMLILIGKETLREIPKPLLPGEEVSVKSNMIIGFGATLITMKFWADNAPLYEGSWTAKILLFFILGIQPVELYQKG